MLVNKASQDHCHADAGLGIRAGYMFLDHWMSRYVTGSYVLATSSASAQAFSLLPGASGIGSLDRGYHLPGSSPFCGVAETGCPVSCASQAFFPKWSVQSRARRLKSENDTER